MAQAGFPFTGLQSEGAAMNYGAVVQGLNQLAVQVNNGTPAVILQTGTSSATANTNAMQVAANSGCLSIAPLPGVYYFNNTITLPGGCVVNIPASVELRAVPVTPSVAGNNFRAFTNTNFGSTWSSVTSITVVMLNPWASGSLGMRATVVAPSHPFTNATGRQVVAIRNDYNDVYNGLWEVENVVDANTFTILLGQGPLAAYQYAGSGPMQCSLGDLPIIIGGGGSINMDAYNTGIWTDRTPTPDYRDHCIAFNKVLRPQVQDLEIKNVRRYSVMYQGCVNPQTRRLQIDSFADGVHHYGPQWDPVVEDIRGTVGDDGVIFQTIDGLGYAQYQAEATGGNIYRPVARRIRYRHTRNSGVVVLYPLGGNSPTAISVNTIANNTPATITGTPIGTGGAFAGGSTYQVQVQARNTMNGEVVYVYTAATGITIAANGSIQVTLPTAYGFVFDILMGLGSISNYGLANAADTTNLAGGQTLTLTNLGSAKTISSVGAAQLFTFTGTAPAAGNAVIFTAANGGIVAGKTYYVLPWGLTSSTMMLAAQPRGLPITNVTTGGSLTLTAKWDVGYQIRGTVVLEDIATHEAIGGGITVGSTSYVVFGSTVDTIQCKNINNIAVQGGGGVLETMLTIGTIMVDGLSNDQANGTNGGGLGNLNGIIGLVLFKSAALLNVNNNTGISLASASNIDQIIFDCVRFMNADTTSVFKILAGSGGTLGRLTFRDCVFGAGVQAFNGGTFAATPTIEVIGGKGLSGHGALVNITGSQALNVRIRDFDNAAQVFNIFGGYTGTLRMDVMGLGLPSSVFINLVVTSASNLQMYNPDGTAPVDITRLARTAKQIAAYDGTTNNITSGTMTGTTLLTVNTIAAGSYIAVGDLIAGSGVTANSIVVSLGTGTGGVGTYTLSQLSTVTAIAMTAVANTLVSNNTCICDSSAAAGSWKQISNTANVF